ncbi:YdcF family protein [Rhizobium sp. PAMB 3174]
MVTEETLHGAPMTESRRKAEPRARRSLFRRVARRVGIVSVLLAGVVFVDFLRFADTVSSYAPPSSPKADAIVVLTGGYQRIDQAVALLAEHAGARLLISGVHPSTTGAQIRKMTDAPKDLFNCCVDIGYAALDTIGNANETMAWIEKNGYRSVLVVTNNYHMPRSLLELRQVEPRIEFLPYPVVNADLKQRNWFADPNAMRTMIAEYVKLLAARLRGLTGIGIGSGLRTGMDG